jgi:hypothetical protein
MAALPGRVGTGIAAASFFASPRSSDLNEGTESKAIAKWARLIAAPESKAAKSMRSCTNSVPIHLAKPMRN